jgi:hypothetical protein
MLPWKSHLVTVSSSVTDYVSSFNASAVSRFRLMNLHFFGHTHATLIFFPAFFVWLCLILWHYLRHYLCWLHHFKHFLLDSLKFRTHLMWHSCLVPTHFITFIKCLHTEYPCCRNIRSRVFPSVLETQKWLRSVNHCSKLHINNNGIPPTELKYDKFDKSAHNIMMQKCVLDSQKIIVFRLLQRFRKLNSYSTTW